jgi:four helix bundle protein
MFDHDKLDVYQRAIEFLDLVDEIVSAAPKGRSHLKDQLDRAATSVVLNIAEGAGEFSTRDKRRFYRMARRSATECAAVIDILARRGHPQPQKLAAGRTLLVRIVSMLVRMVSASRAEQPGTGTGTGAFTGRSR